MNILITGHTGFKGSWLSLWLNHLGHKVHGMGLGPPSTLNMWQIVRSVFESEQHVDVVDLEDVTLAIHTVKPDLIYHLAAEAIVRNGQINPVQTFHTNAVGTMNILESVRRLDCCPIVIVTSDKCYAPSVEPHAETDPMGGDDIYSMSKGCAELIVHAWRGLKMPPVVTVRAGNVIGGGDYADGRIVPDLVRSRLQGTTMQVHRPESIRPWQHVLDCLSGYIVVGGKLLAGSHSEASSFNFGPDPNDKHTVRELVETFNSVWTGTTEYSSNPSSDVPLTLSIAKARAELNWKPTWDFATAVKETALWYQHRHVEKGDMLDYSVKQIERFNSCPSPAPTL